MRAYIIDIPGWIVQSFHGKQLNCSQVIVFKESEQQQNDRLVTSFNNSNPGNSEFLLLVSYFKQLFLHYYTKVALAGQQSVSAACSEDFSPCTCSDSSDIWSIACDGVRLSEIKQIFQRSAHSVFGSLDITFSTLDSDVTAPFDLLAGKIFNGALRLYCTSSDHLLKIDPVSFGSSNNFSYTSITGCNISQQPDFGFMTNFTMLRQLWISHSSGFNSFRGVPSQSNLFQISITNSASFESLDRAKVVLAGLRELLLYNNDLSDFSAERAVSALASYSTNSLIELRLYGNRLTAIPPSVHLITSLSYIMMENNQIRVLGSGTLSFPATSRVSYLNLVSNDIERVEPGAFSGEFLTLLVRLFQMWQDWLV